jgi:hypothetical protein
VTLDARPWTVTDLSEKELAATRENAADVEDFLRAFLSPGWVGSDWGVAELDRAFEAWLKSSDSRGYMPDAVVAIMGAAFGEFCARTLSMRWVAIRDQYGKSAGLIGVEAAVTCFPYDTVAKRIDDEEFGFFLPVYTTIKNGLMDQDTRRDDGSSTIAADGPSNVPGKVKAEIQIAKPTAALGPL